MTNSWNLKLFFLTVLFSIICFSSFDRANAGEVQILSDACFKGKNLPHKSRISISGRIMTCTKAIVGQMFEKVDEKSQPTVIANVKKAFHSAVLAAIVLFVSLKGWKITTSGETPSSAEIINDIIKIGIVAFLCLGNGMTYLYEGASTFLTNLPVFMMEAASSSNTLCVFDQTTYPEPFSFLALWDGLDCRFMDYLKIGGMGVARTAVTGAMTAGAGVAGAATATAVTAGAGAPLLGAAAALVFLMLGLEAIIVLIFLIFIFFVIMMVAALLHFMVLCYISLAIFLYAGFLFVPMMLFDYTKSFFDKWWKGVLSLVIQPVVFTAGIALAFSVFDSLFYQDCTFNKTQDAQGNAVQTVSNCHSNSPGFKLQQLINDSAGIDNQTGMSIQSNSKDILFFKAGSFKYFAVTNAAVYLETLVSFLLLLLYCLLFFIFTSKLGALAKGLTSGPNIGAFAVSIASMAQQGFQMATAFVSLGSTIGGKIKDAIKSKSDSGK